MTTQNKNVPALRFPEFDEKWEVKKLSELADFISGFAFNSELFGSEGKKLIIPKNFTKFGFANFTNGNTKYTTEIVDNKFLCGEGDLLILLTDLTPSCELLGKPLLLTKEDGEVLLNQRIVKLVTNKKQITKVFLSNFFLTNDYHKRIKETASGSTVRHSSNKILASTNIYFPTLPEQQKIATFLTVVDEKIQQLTKKKDLLEQYKKGVMQKIFNQEIRFKDDNGNDFADWEEKKLGDFTFWASGGTPSKDIDSYWNGDIPWISGSSMRGIKYSNSKLKITVEGLKNGSKLAQKGSLLILVRGSMLFNTIPVGITTRDVAFNQDVKSIKCNEETSPIYLLYWFISSENKILNMVSGTGIGAGKLDLIELKRLDIFLPSLPEQQKIADFLSAIDDKLNSVNQQLEKTQAYKKGLLQQMFV
jgi:type I restriction enzyme S subunit